MFEAYSIGVRLKLENLISPQLKIISDEFVKLEGLSVALQKSLKGIAVESAGLKSLAAAGNASNKALHNASVSAAALQKQLVAIRSASAFAAASPGGFIPMHPVGGGIGAGGAAAAGMGASPRLAGGAGGGRLGGGAGGRGGPPGGFHGGNLHIGPNGVGVGTVGMAMGDWFWPVAASMAAFSGGKALFESAKSLDTGKQQFALLGMTPAQNQEAFDFVKDHPIFGTTQLERLSAFREAQGVGRESGLAGSKALEFAKLASPVLAKLDALGQGLDDESKSALHQSNVSLLRFVEQSGGLKGPAGFERLANLGYKLRQSSGGTVDFQKMLGVTQQGGVYTQGMTEEGWALAEPILQEVGGAAYGTGKMTAGQRLNNTMSRTPRNLIELATRLKLWTPGRQHLSDTDAALFKASQEKFYIERIMPLYDSLHLSQTDRDRDDAILFGRTGGKNVGRIQKALPAIQKSVEAFRKSKGIDSASDQLKSSLSGQELEFVAAWEDFKTQFGNSMLPSFSGILKAGAWTLRQVAKYPDALGFLVHPLQTLENLGEKGLNVFAPSQDKTPVVNVNNHYDEDGIMTNVTRSQSRAASRPQTGFGLLNDRLGPYPAGGL